MTTPNTEIQRYTVAAFPCSHPECCGSVECKHFGDKDGFWVRHSDHLAAIARAREESRREALEEMKPMRDLVAELTALDFGCISGDCPHEHRDECRVYMEGQMKQIAREARSYFPAATPQEDEVQP